MSGCGIYMTIDTVFGLYLMKIVLHMIDNMEASIELLNLVGDSEFVNACIEDKECWRKWIEIRYIETKLNNDPWNIIISFIHNIPAKGIEG